MNNWTPERVERAKTMWLDGASATEVARALGGVTRNAVVGKMNRLGLKRSEGLVKATRELGRQNVGRKGAAALAKARAAQPAEARERRVIHASPTINKTRMAPMPPAKAGRIFDASAAKMWTERKFGECAYPVSGEGAETMSCCLPAEPHGYCKRHAAIMFTPGMSPRDLVRSVRRAA